MTERTIPTNKIWNELRRMEIEGLITLSMSDDGQPMAKLTEKGREFAAQRAAAIEGEAQT